MVEGIDAPKVTDWVAGHVPGATPPLDFELIAGGRSNLTYRVTDADGDVYALRRPPTGHVLPTAHDMGREYTIISALQDTPVPVPTSYALCTDEDVNGAPFYVMGFVEGTILRTHETASELAPDVRRRAGESLIEVLSELHSVDPDAVGLGELGRKEGYIERQLRRWSKQWEASKTRELPQIEDVHRKLSDNVPDQGPATIVHGDYRLDNCVLDPDGNVAAVLDWELCTLGDPLADVGLLMVYWADRDDPNVLGSAQAPTTLEGFPTKAELRKRYSELTGRDLSELDFYVAFGYWKLACILEGVLKRYRGGAMAGDRSDMGFSERVEMLANAAVAATERLGI